MARAATVDRYSRCISRLAMVRRHRGCLLESLPARLCIGSRAQDYVATWDLVRMKPPIIRLSELRAQVVVVSIAGARENHPATGKFVGKNTRFGAAQSWEPQQIGKAICFLAA